MRKFKEQRNNAKNSHTCDYSINRCDNLALVKYIVLWSFFGDMIFGEIGQNGFHTHTHNGAQRTLINIYYRNYDAISNQINRFYD